MTATKDAGRRQKAVNGELRKLDIDIDIDTEIQRYIDTEIRVKVEWHAQCTKNTKQNTNKKTHINIDVYVLLELQKCAIERTPEAADEQRAAAE